MTAFKISLIAVLYFLSRVTFAAPCVQLKSPTGTVVACWFEKHEAWLSERCLKEDCNAKNFLSSKKAHIELETTYGGQNPATQFCHDLKLPVIILRDSRNNEQSFCTFPDNSLLDANGVQGNFN